MRTGVPCDKNRFFLVRIYYTGKTLFWPCTGPLRDCSVSLPMTILLWSNRDILFKLWYISRPSCHGIGHTLNMHHDYAFNLGHDPYNENSFENKKLSTYVLNVAFNIAYRYVHYVVMCICSS